MKYLIGGLVILLLAACSDQTQEKAITSLDTARDSVSYSIGMDIGTSFKMQSIDVNEAVFYQGLKDAYQGEETILSENDARTVVMAFQQKLRKRQQETRKQQTSENKIAGEAFLVENAKKEGIVTLPSGLQYKVLHPGDGPSPIASDKVKVHYRGTLLDGTVFDSSYDRGESVSFKVTGVIKGWTEALQLMRVGDKWELYIPSDLAYGERGGGAKIGPNSTLIFEVELLGIE